VELLVFRHGLAGEREDWAKTGRPDSERPLTAEGRRKTEEAAEGAAALAEADLVLTSPWARASETAAMLAEQLGCRVSETEALLPSAPFEALARELDGLEKERVAVVGHEPHLSRFVSWLLGVEGRSALQLKKAQAALLELKKAGPGRATLLWSVPPKALRRLA
jgi:phosphohistidine phosphatase